VIGKKGSSSKQHPGVQGNGGKEKRVVRQPVKSFWWQIGRPGKQARMGRQMRGTMKNAHAVKDQGVWYGGKGEKTALTVIQWPRSKAYSVTGGGYQRPRTVSSTGPRSANISLTVIVSK